MGTLKGPADAGQGGKRGHSNMEHWETTEEIKGAARKRRRLDASVKSYSGWLSVKRSTKTFLAHDQKWLELWLILATVHRVESFA